MLGRRCWPRDTRRPALATDGDTLPPMLRLRFFSVCELADANDARLRARDAMDALLPRLRARDATDAFDALEALLWRRVLSRDAPLPRRFRDTDEGRALSVAELMLCRR